MAFQFFSEIYILRFYGSSYSCPIFVLRVCSIVTLYVPFVKSEAAVQKCYIKISVLKIFESFQEKPVVKFHFNKIVE